MERATATPYFPNANQKQTRIVVTQIVAFAQIVLRIVEGKLLHPVPLL